jgi:hypothetical protein
MFTKIAAKVVKITVFFISLKDQSAIMIEKVKLFSFLSCWYSLFFQTFAAI